MAEFEIDFPFTFGDLICYRYEPGTLHDSALMYLGICRHNRTPIGKRAYVVEDGLIDILDVGDPANLGHIEHRDPAMWRRCDHFAAWTAAIHEVSGTFEGVLTEFGADGLSWTWRKP